MERRREISNREADNGRELVKVNEKDLLHIPIIPDKILSKSYPLKGVWIRDMVLISLTSREFRVVISNAWSLEPNRLVQLPRNH